ncbi:IS3 family transposase, partial [Escherichia coli]
ALTFQNHTDCPLTDFGGKTSIFSHPVYLFLRKFSLQDSRGGSHYRWPGWLERVNAAGLIRSMSRKGCSPDNAACEGFFGRLKTEMYYGRKWSGITPEKFMQHVDAYIRWYNERRIKLSLGAVSPEMYRQQCGLA